jgi:cephalosporin-C deacetylase
MFVDLPEAELRRYRSAQADPADFDEFWASTLAESRAMGGPVEVERVRSGLATIEVFDVTFPGFRGQPIKAWLRLPKHRSGPLPAVVQYVGYGGGRGRATEELLWASAGFAHLQMDTRGQGSSWSVGDTADPDGGGAQHPGFMTRGIGSPETYYYRRLITDAVRAVDAARSLPEVAAERVAVVGKSQGGGIAIAAAALAEGVCAAVCSVPFLCDFPRATVITDNPPFVEIARYLAVHRESIAVVHDTLSYVDGVNFAKRATVPGWFSVGLMDSTCPPSTVFAAFAEWGGPKELSVWPYNGHEGGGADEARDAVASLQELFGLEADASAA